MDPDEARKRMVSLANVLLYELDRKERDFDQIIVLGTGLAETVQDLDEWLRGGGFLPDVWRLPLQRWRSPGHQTGRHKDA